MNQALQAKTKDIRRARESTILRLSFESDQAHPFIEMHMRLLTTAIVTALFALPAAAQIYQCKDASGKLSFSDSPCSSADAGALIQRKKSNDEISRERADAAEANERKHQRQMNEMQQRQIESQQRVIEQQARQASAPAPEQLGNSLQCKEARKELEFISSIRTISQDEKRMRTNAAITSVNAACGSNTPLMQEPPKVIGIPRAAQPIQRPVPQ